MPQEFFSEIYRDVKPPTLVLRLRKAICHFLNTAAYVCDDAEYTDEWNENRRNHLNVLNTVEFAIDEHLKCGWMILLEENAVATLVFYISYGKRVILVKGYDGFLYCFGQDIPDLERIHGGFINFDSGVVHIRKGAYGERWFVIHEVTDWQFVGDLKQVREPSRIVMCDAQFTHFAKILEENLPK
jgi:hypothetical protein